MQKNRLYYGDNLIVIREHIADESVDLIYLDPPFNRRQDYNVLFAEEPSKPMFKEAADAGFYQPPGLADKYPRLQILTIAELLMGKAIQFPRLLEVTHKCATKAKSSAAGTQLSLGGSE